MIEVKSSAIRGVEMSSEGLRVTFNSGRCYEYAGVTQEQMLEMVNADSPGYYLATEIKPNHEAVPVEDGSDTREQAE